MIPLNIPTCTGEEQNFVAQLMQEPTLLSKGHFTEKCTSWFKKRYNAPHLFLTKSCTSALEMAAMLVGVQPGDEVVLPSFTFVSAANAFVLRGARLVFVDIDPATMNIAPQKIEAAITEKTKAILLMHYAGMACDMAQIMEIGQRHKLPVIEDAAHCINAKWKGHHLGTIGDAGCLSFDHSKNITCSQGGVLFVKNEKLRERAEVLFENGSDKRSFDRGEIPFYSWVDVGSNFKISEVNAACLYEQLLKSDEIISRRLANWHLYYRKLAPLAEQQKLMLPPTDSEHNAHIFYIKLPDEASRDAMMKHLNKKGIGAAFHYIPLHSSVMGKKCSTFSGEDQFTSIESGRLLRLPLYHTITTSQIESVIAHVYDFFEKEQG